MTDAFVDEDGFVYFKPVCPPSPSPSEHAAWVKELDWYNAKLRDVANRAFDDQFRKTLKSLDAQATKLKPS